MIYKKETGLLNDLLSIAEFGIYPENPNDPFISFGLAKHSVAFRGIDNYTSYHNTIEFLYQANNEIAESYTLKTFENEIIELLKKFKKEDRLAMSSDIDFLYHKLLSVNLSKYEVFNELFGATLASPRIEFGDFTIYNLSLFKDEIFKKYPQLKVHEDLRGMIPFCCAIFL